MTTRGVPEMVASRVGDRPPANAVIIGAGPYGLAAAGHLAAKNVGMRCFGTTMSGWEDHMPAGMFLKSTASATAIGAPEPGYSLGDYCDHVGIERFDLGGGEVPIPLSVFVAYGHWFQEQLVPTLERTNVVHVAPRGAGYEVVLESGETVECGAVVVASGLTSYAYVPPELEKLERSVPPARASLSHTCDHVDLSRFRGSRVAVVGAGQSALETAVLLHEQGAEVELIARRTKLAWNASPLGREPSFSERLRRPPSPLGASWALFLVSRFAGQFHHLSDATRLRIVKEYLGPAGGWWLKERFTSEISVHLGTTVVGSSSDDGSVKMDVADRAGNRDRIVVDHVIAATGYRVDVAKLTFLDDDLRSELATIAGSPRLSPRFACSRQGLYFVGLPAAATFGPLMRFVAGSDFAARRVAQDVASRLGAGSRR